MLSTISNNLNKGVNFVSETIQVWPIERYISVSSILVYHFRYIAIFYIYKYIYIYIYNKNKSLLWEPKMCRLAWQLLGMLGNVLGRPRHALQCPRHACNILSVLGYGSLVVHYFLSFIAYKAASGGVLS